MTDNDKITFWEESWRRFKTLSPMDKNDNGNQDRRLKRWNQMAAEFAKNTSDEKAQKRRQEVLAMLIKKDVLTPKTKVLDIGAGPGYWAVSMAAMVAHVTALEPAEAMTAILKEQIKERKISNISIDMRTFQQIDLEKENRQGVFDLVFASMTPGIDGPGALYKMMAASKKYCYLSAFSGSGWQKEYDQLWQELFEEDMGRRSNDIIYPFNLLYALGYRPGLEFHFWKRKRSWDREQAIEHYCLMVEERKGLTPTLKERIVAFVDRRYKDGALRISDQVCQGIMVWDKNDRVES
ncbi:MAG: class I SAM-dependent methyltransferase [Desulfobacteraceae bacterium]|jgi:SAM-dependent methyltransferase